MTIAYDDEPGELYRFAKRLTRPVDRHDWLLDLPKLHTIYVASDQLDKATIAKVKSTNRIQLLGL